MGSIDIKLLLAEEVQLPLSKIEPVIKQAINLYNNTTIKTNKKKKKHPQKLAICSIQLTLRPTKQTHLHLNEVSCKW